MNPPSRTGPQPDALPPRPQVGIERLPARHLPTEPRESMNCKSCRKRKIKCNRLRPSCEACQVFQCPCIYDAVPKKRGPKTDVLEALLKRVDGLEAKLKEKNESEQTSQSTSTPGSADSPASVSAPLPTTSSSTSAPTSRTGSQAHSNEPDVAEPPPKRVAIEDNTPPGIKELPVYSPRTSHAGEPSIISPLQPDVVLNTYFTHFHGKPYHILDEATVRHRHQTNQLPTFLLDAIFAVAMRRAPHPQGPQAAIKLSSEYANRARAAIDTDEPAIEVLQTLMLLVLAFTAEGKVKKSYMLTANAAGMAMALELHREIDPHIRVPSSEREHRRRLFWTCFLMDRFMTAGSRRSSLIVDDYIILRLPSWVPAPSALPVDGEFYACGSNLSFFQGAGKRSQGPTGMLIDISRILGVTNRYLATGGVKKDSHFPWHSLSILSKIRQELDVWASGNGDMFSSVDATCGPSDAANATILTQGKLIYHCIHCLIYRPFLPISLAELAGNGQHQSWQIEATNMCFYHAKAIVELVETAKQSGVVEFTPIMGYIICTAGTAHIHGAYYAKQDINVEMNVYNSSTDLLSREMQLLGELRHIWAVIQDQREMLHRLYDAHSELVSRTMSGNMMRYTPGFQLEDFFDRYANIGMSRGVAYHFDTHNLSLPNLMPETLLQPPQPSDQSARMAHLKRKSTAQSPHEKILEMKASHPLALAGSTYPPPPRSSMPLQNSMMQHHQHHQHHQQQQQHQQPPPPPPHMMHQTPMEHPHMSMRTPDITPSPSHHAVATYGLSHSPPSHPAGITPMTGMPYGPSYSYNTVSTPTSNHAIINDGSGGYDAMFGGMPAFGSPAGWATDGYRMIAAPSPSTKSNSGSTATTGDERDPFMSLLEQLANDEQRQHNGLKGDLDFFLAGTTGPS